MSVQITKADGLVAVTYKGSDLGLGYGATALAKATNDPDIILIQADSFASPFCFGWHRFPSSDFERER